MIITLDCKENYELFIGEHRYYDPDISEGGTIIRFYLDIDENRKMRCEVSSGDGKGEVFNLLIRINTEPGFFDDWEYCELMKCVKKKKI